ncbi:MAG: nuclear transport factor 2 family protein [FCB group bacterium]|jgi:ketosteroid isomerase-like protein
MSNSIDLKVVQQCYAEFEKGNIPGIIDNLSNDVEWVNPGANDAALTGTYRGKKEVAEFFSRLNAHNEFTRFEAREFIPDTDKIVVMGYSNGVSRLTGRKFESDWVMVWTMQNNKVKRYINFVDNTAFANAEKPNKDNFELIETALAGMECFETGNIDRAMRIVREDFQFVGPMPMPLNREQYFAISRAIAEGIPNWSFNISNIKVIGNEVHLSVDITGTHTGVLALPIPGLAPIQPTRKSIKIPQEVIQITVREKRISKLNVPQVPGGGIPGLLEQLGHPMPRM